MAREMARRWRRFWLLGSAVDEFWMLEKDYLKLELKRSLKRTRVKLVGLTVIGIEILMLWKKVFRKDRKFNIESVLFSYELQYVYISGLRRHVE